MPCPRPLAVALAGVALGLAACGGDGQAARCTPHASPSPPVATAGPLTATADAAVVPAGGTVAATLHVTGPLAYQAPRPPRPRPPPAPPAAPPPPPAARGGGPAGGPVPAPVHVTGPFAYQAPCTAPLSLIVVDSADIHVDSEGPPAPKGTPCGAVNLAA